MDFTINKKIVIDNKMYEHFMKVMLENQDPEDGDNKAAAAQPQEGFHYQNGEVRMIDNEDSRDISSLTKLQFDDALEQSFI